MGNWPIGNGEAALLSRGRLIKGNYFRLTLIHGSRSLKRLVAADQLSLVVQQVGFDIINGFLI